MLRRYLSTVKVGAELFPTAGSVLAAADPWCISLPAELRPQLQTNTASGRLASIIMKKDFQAGWYLFSQSQHQLSTELLRKLLATLPSGSESAHLWWPRASEIKRELLVRRSRLTSSDYAVLINLAAKAGKRSTVESLWIEMSEFGVTRDTNVWNQYIMAVCDANPQFWPWPRSRSTSFARYQSRLESTNTTNSTPATSPETRDVITLLEQMELEGISHNSRTYELVILALSRSSETNLSSCAKVIERMWGATSSRTAGISTALSILDAFAFHNQLLTGYVLAKSCMPTSRTSQLGSHSASDFWKRVLRLTVAQVEPRGNVPTQFFDEVWQNMTVHYGYKPTLSEYFIKSEFLELKNRFTEMFESIPAVLLVSGGKTLAQSITTRAAVGMINTNNALDAAKNLQNVKALGVVPNRDLEPMLSEHGASLEQLKLFEEDDDEDSLI